MTEKTGLHTHRLKPVRELTCEKEWEVVYYVGWHFDATRQLMLAVNAGREEPVMEWRPGHARPSTLSVKTNQDRQELMDYIIC